MATPRRKAKASDGQDSLAPPGAAAIHAATWIMSRALPNLIWQGVFDRERPRLEKLYRLVYEKDSTMPSNWDGVSWKVTDRDEDHEEYVRERRGDAAYDARKNTWNAAKAYVGAVQRLSRRWRFSDSYGPHLIHQLVRSTIVYGGDRFQPPATLSRPVRLTLTVEIDAMTPYYENDLDVLAIEPNHELRALAPFYKRGERIPSVEWHRDGVDYTATMRVREARELLTHLPKLLEKMENDEVIRLRGTRSDAYKMLPRNVRWFYLNRCEEATAESIADQDDIEDAQVVHKGIAQVEALLSLLRVS